MTTEPVEKLEEVFLGDSNHERTTKIETLASPTVCQALQKRDQAIVEKVRKLQEASFIREVYYPD